MSIFRKKMPNGKMSPTFHYRVMVDGKIHTGSTGCATRVDALKFERDKLDVLRQQRSAKAVVENFRDELAGGKRIDLNDAFEAFRAKPKRKGISDRQMRAKETYWSDWLAFLNSEFPAVRRLSDVTVAAAEAYIQHLRTSGKFVKTVEYRPARRRKAITYQGGYTQLSPRTVNVYHKTLQQVFGTLADDASLIENPFGKIAKQENEYQQRDAFTPDELKKIGEASRAGDPFIFALFAIGMATGLREGDICTLRWQEIDLVGGWITRKMSKTGKLVRIPIMPPLRAFLDQAAAARQEGEEYVLPEHARVYLSNPSGIGYRVRGFLEGLKITTTKKVEGRSRMVSVKDVHSLRHTFCYLAAIHDVPANIVQSIVGHMDERMTQMYMDHASDQVKRDKLRQLPDYLSQLQQGSTTTPAPPPAHEGVARAIDILEQMRDGDPGRWPELRDRALQALRALR